MPVTLANIITSTSLETQARTTQASYPWIPDLNVYCFKPLNFEIICYTAIGNQHTILELMIDFANAFFMHSYILSSQEVLKVLL